mgnify:CR=1 FL=1
MNPVLQFQAFGTTSRTKNSAVHQASVLNEKSVGLACADVPRGGDAHTGDLRGLREILTMFDQQRPVTGFNLNRFERDFPDGSDDGTNLQLVTHVQLEQLA